MGLASCVDPVGGPLSKQGKRATEAQFGEAFPADERYNNDKSGTASPSAKSSYGDSHIGSINPAATPPPLRAPPQPALTLTLTPTFTLTLTLSLIVLTSRGLVLKHRAPSRELLP